jgi:hypothetical protein
MPDARETPFRRQTLAQPVGGSLAPEIGGLADRLRSFGAQAQGRGTELEERDLLEVQTATLTEARDRMNELRREHEGNPAGYAAAVGYDETG